MNCQLYNDSSFLSERTSRTTSIKFSRREPLSLYASKPKLHHFLSRIKIFVSSTLQMFSEYSALDKTDTCSSLVIIYLLCVRMEFFLTEKVIARYNRYIVSVCESDVMLMKKTMSGVRIKLF